MKRVLFAIGGITLFAGAAIADVDCGENGKTMIYDVAAVAEVVQEGHNVLVLSGDGNHGQSWNLTPQAVSCNDTELTNFVLRAADGTEIERLPGVEAIGELVRVLVIDQQIQDG